MDTDEDAQAQSVMRDRLWLTFMETVAKRIEPPPDQGQMESDCRSSIKMARLTSKELLLDGCISTALERIDPVASYIDQSRFQSIQREKLRPPAAIGLEIASRKKYGEPLQVVSVIEGGPAEKSGIQAGDLIDSIGDVQTYPLTQDEVIDLLRGDTGSVVQVTLRRGESKLNYSVKRDGIAPRLVRSKVISESVLYIRLSRFRSGHSAAQMLEVIHAQAPAADKLKAWIVDLRFNPGGSLAEVVSVASIFVPDGEPVLGVRSAAGLVLHESRFPTEDPRVKQSVEALLTLPLLVLVDGGTGSGAEALAQLLRDRSHAKMVGEPTAGIDNVLETFELQGKAAVQLTVGHIVPASGRGTLAPGLEPEVLVANTPGAEYGDIQRDGVLAAALEEISKRR